MGFKKLSDTGTQQKHTHTSVGTHNTSYASMGHHVDKESAQTLPSPTSFEHFNEKLFIYKE